MDSSLVVVPPAVGRPLRLLPFRGWRLTPGRIGDPATARLFARPYRDVAERLDRWREAGQLLEDHQPAVYVHEYTSAGLTVRGLVGALDISHRATSADDRTVVPHEGIHPDQVSDLADRMSTWQLNPAPILLVHRGPRSVRELVDRALTHAPLHEYVDRADQRHRVWAIHDPVDLDDLNAGLAGSRALIADGHHRYAAYLRMQQQAPGGANDRGLAMLVDQAVTPLFLGAIHRTLLGTSLDELGRACPPIATFAPVAARRRVRRAVAGHPGGHRRRAAGPRIGLALPRTGPPSRCCTTTCCRPSGSPTGGSGSTTRSTRRSAGSARHRASRS